MSHSNETSSSSDSTEQSLNSQSSESSSKVNFQQFMDKYHEFDLKKELGEIRTDINNHLSQYDPMLKVARKFLQDPFISMDNVVTDTYRISSDLNSKYPYMASLFRSHESLIVGGSVGVAALVLRKLPRRLWLLSVFSTYAAVQGTSCTFNFKWKNPSYKPKDEQ